jgi:hypothetical protein
MNKAAALMQINREAQPLDLDTVFDHFNHYLSPLSSNNNGPGNANMAMHTTRPVINDNFNRKNDNHVNSRFQQNQEINKVPRTREPRNNERRSSSSTINQPRYHKNYVREDIHRFQSYESYQRKPYVHFDDLYNYCLYDIKQYDPAPEDDIKLLDIQNSLAAIQQQIKLSVSQQSNSVDLLPTTNHEQTASASSSDSPTNSVPTISLSKAETPSSSPPLSDLNKYSQLHRPIKYVIDQLGTLSKVDGEKVSNQDIVTRERKRFVQDVSLNYAFALQLTKDHELIYSDDTRSVFDYSRYKLREKYKNERIYINKTQSFPLSDLFSLDLSRFNFNDNDRLLDIISTNLDRIGRKCGLDGTGLFAIFILLAVIRKYRFKREKVFLRTVLDISINVSSYVDDVQVLALINYVRKKKKNDRFLNEQIKTLFSYVNKFFYADRLNIYRLLLYVSYVIK